MPKCTPYFCDFSALKALYKIISISTPQPKNEGESLLLIKMNCEKQKQSGGKDEQFRLFVLFVLRKAL